MKFSPRLLPLVGVAAAGVLGLKMAGGVDGVSSLIGARAQAEEASIPKGGKLREAESAASAAQSPVQAPGALPGLPSQSQANAPAVGPAVCAPSATELAKQAGLSPAELQVIQTLGSRRGQLDAREQALDTQLQLIAAAEEKLNGHIQALNGLKSEIQSLIGQVDAAQQAEIDRLVVVYEKMSAKQAGPLMAVLDDKVRLPLAAKMKPTTLAKILAQMDVAQGKALSEKLAKRFAPSETLMQAFEGKRPAPEAAQPAQTAAAQSVAAAPPAAADAKAAPAKAAPTPRRQAKAAPPRRRAPPAKPTDAEPKAEPAAVAASGATSKPTKTAAAAPPAATPPAAAPRPTAGPPA